VSFSRRNKRVPFFGWYPNRLKRHIMIWAQDKHPFLIGFTDIPAVNWWTYRKAKAKLCKVGFSQVWDRWELKNPEELSGIGKDILLLIKRWPLLRRFLDIIIPDCSFAARKPR